MLLDGHLDPALSGEHFDPGILREEQADTISSHSFISPRILFIALVMGTAPFGFGQSSTNADALAQKGIALAQKGRCRDATLMLKSASSRVTDKHLKFQSAMLLARCAMSEDHPQTAVEALMLLNRDFPDDPEVLYNTTHYYSELASRASQRLAATAPNSSQAQKLEAEAFESQGDWEKASAEYRKILERAEKEPEIHFRLGRILLSKNPPDREGAGKEFQEELRVNPNDAPAEFML